MHKSSNLQRGLRRKTTVIQKTEKIPKKNKIPINTTINDLRRDECRLKLTYLQKINAWNLKRLTKYIE